MEKSIQDMVLVGYHHFSSKDKSTIYYVVQCLYNKYDGERNNNKGTMINIFVTEEIYKIIINKSVGEVLKVSITPNLENGKIYYGVVL